MKTNFETLFYSSLPTNRSLTYPAYIYIPITYYIQDLPNAMNAAEITDKLGLHNLRQRKWHTQVLLDFTRLNY